MRPQKGVSLTHASMPDRWGRTLGLVLLGLIMVPLTVLTAFGIAPGAAPIGVAQQTVDEPIALPAYVSESVAADHFVTQERVMRGDTVAAIFDRLGIHDPGFMQ